MKALAPHATVAALLGALLLLAGCYTSPSARTAPGRENYRFAVVDKSPDLTVTPQLMADLRESVADYLRQEGLGRAGEYLVRVNFAPDPPKDTGEWVVLRIVSQSARTYTLLAAYPGADDYYPYDFSGIYDFGYPSFARYGYGYYDPFNYGYGYAGYVPLSPVPPKNYQPRDGDRHPPTSRPRWEGNRPHPDRTNRPADYQPRPSDPRHDGRDRSNDHSPGGSGPGHGGGGGSYSPPPPAYNPPPAPPPPPPAAERNSNSTGDPTEAR